jgi:molybdopterin synthase sulfur carrier subunit
MANLHLPQTLTSLFPGLPRRVEVDATTVTNAIAELDERWPGVYDRLLETGPSLRPHIHVYVDGARATLDTTLGDRSRLDVVAAISGG